MQNETFSTEFAKVWIFYWGLLKQCAIKEPYVKLKDRFQSFSNALFLLIFFLPLLLFIKLSLDVVLPNSERSLNLTLLSLFSKVSFEFVVLYSSSWWSFLLLLLLRLSKLSLESLRPYSSKFSTGITFNESTSEVVLNFSFPLYYVKSNIKS